MPMSDIPTPDEYWEGLRPHLRPFSMDEQRAAVALYRELAKGQAVTDAQLAHALGVSTVESSALLQRDAIKPLSTATASVGCLALAGSRLCPCIIASRSMVASFLRGAPGTAFSFRRFWD